MLQGVCCWTCSFSPRGQQEECRAERGAARPGDEGATASPVCKQVSNTRPINAEFARFPRAGGTRVTFAGPAPSSRRLCATARLGVSSLANAPSGPAVSGRASRDSTLELNSGGFCLFVCLFVCVVCLLYLYCYHMYAYIYIYIYIYVYVCMYV